MVGDTYTVLLSGEQTAGRFALIDMLIPAGGGPPPHRHDFEECFRVLEGSVEVTLRDDPPLRLEPGRRSTSRPTRRTRSATPPTSPRDFCAPPFRQASRRSSPSSATASTSRTSPPPELSDEEQQARLRRAVERAPDYGMELLPPSG